MIPYRTEYGCTGVFEKTSLGRSYGTIALVTRAHVYTLKAMRTSSRSLGRIIKPREDVGTDDRNVKQPLCDRPV